MHRLPVAIGHDERAVVGGFHQLIVGADRPASAGIRHAAFGLIGVLRRDCGTDVFQTQFVGAELSRVYIDPYGRRGTAADLHLTDPADLRQPLLENRRRRVIQCRWRQLVRRERYDHDRRCRRGDFTFSIGGIDRQIGGAGCWACRIDCRLHVARRRIDAAGQIELQRDAGLTQGALRGHFGDRRDPAEFALQRRCDG